MRQKPLIMGILNVTPDSFYDGGRFLSTEKACERARAMVEEGADIIDMGGESTGPGSSAVSVEEELRRVMPVVERVRDRVRVRKCLTSVDTYKAEVAKRTLDAGAEMINDVTAGRADPEMFALIAEEGCSYIMMHSKDDSPRTTVKNVHYDDVLQTIHDFFEERLEKALRAGVKKEQLILDPGLGHFVSSDPQYSWQILENLEFFKDFGCPLLVSPSRKSFTATRPNQPSSQRLEGTLEATKLALEHGADIIRTHDVGETLLVIRQLVTRRATSDE